MNWFRDHLTPRRERIGLFLIIMVAMALTAFALKRDSQTRTQSNRHLIISQQIQGAEITFTTCLDQNSRHDKTIDRLDQLLARAVKTNPERAREIRQTRASTIFIIEALAPHQNCRQLVLDRYGFVPNIQKGDR